VFGSDAQQYLPPESYDRTVQIPAIQMFLVCGSEFASLVYDFGLRWLPLSDASTPESDLELALNPLGRRGTYWLRDMWSGRELVPDVLSIEPEVAPDWRAWHHGLSPKDDGAPPFVPSFGIELIPEIRDVWRSRRLIFELGSDRRAYLNDELPVFHCKSRLDIEQNLAAISKKLLPFSPRLWFRGQVSDYALPRSPRGPVGRWLGLSPEGSEPSLMPSIARPGPGGIPEDPEEAMIWASTSDFIWRAPLISWLGEQPGYAPRDPEAQAILDRLTDDVRENIGEALYTIQFHPELDDLDDLRQWWIEGIGRSTVVPLWMQHYGARTSVLDVTSDLDTALYFAHRVWNDDAGAFVDAPAASGPCVFIFAERSQGSGDRYITDTDALLRADIHFAPPPRIVQQSCGLLRGSNAHAQNRALDLALALLDLSEFTFDAIPDDEAMYPPPSDDAFFARLLRTNPAPPGLMRFGR
jgi:hypothetical protein